MSVSLIIVWILILLVMFGAGQRILDGMRLSDKEALIFLVLICIGLIIPPVWIGEHFCFSIGGFLLPFALCIYLLFSCGFSRDLVRCLIGTLLIAGIVYGLEWVLPADPENVIIDNMYIYGIVSGVVAYVLGRSRRNAFVACLFGLTVADLIGFIVGFLTNAPVVLGLGVGGAFGTYLVVITISVALCEFLGRCFENANTGNKREEKEFNYNTHVFDSVKNGKLDKGGEDRKQNRIKLTNKIKNANNIKKQRKSIYKTSKGAK